MKISTRLNLYELETARMLKSSIVLTSKYSKKLEARSIKKKLESSKYLLSLWLKKVI